MGKKLTTEEAIERIKKRCLNTEYTFHGFVSGDYNGNKSKLRILCNKHNKTWDVTYGAFVVDKNGCKLCANELTSKRMSFSKDKVLKDVLEICNDLNYNFMGFDGDYSGVKTRVKLYCDKHNIEWNTTTVYYLLRGMTGCVGCKGGKISNGVRRSEEEVKEKILNTCNEKNYEFLGYKNNSYIDITKTFLILRCKKDNHTWDSTNIHSFINGGNGCKMCGRLINGGLKKEDAIKNITKEAHKRGVRFGGFVDNNWSGVVKSYLILECPIHGEWTTTNYRGFMDRGVGCPVCRKSKMETTCETLLQDSLIKYTPQKTFEWLKNKEKLVLDFYLPDHNIAIECQGIQHFVRFGFEQDDEQLKIRQQRDQLKKRLCEENGVKLYYINYNDSVEERLNEILKRD